MHVGGRPKFVEQHKCYDYAQLLWLIQNALRARILYFSAHLLAEVLQRIAEICGDCHFLGKMTSKYCGDLQRRRIRARAARKDAKLLACEIPYSCPWGTSPVSPPPPGERGVFCRCTNPQVETFESFPLSRIRGNFWNSLSFTSMCSWFRLLETFKHLESVKL